MYPLGHIAFTLAVGTRLNLSAGFLALGVLLPDLVDKTLVIFFGIGGGRYIAHTLSFAVLAGAIALLHSRKAALSASFGVFAHLVEDSYSFIPWFYPLLDYDFPLVEGYSIFDHYLGVFGIGTDILGVVLLAALYRDHAEQLSPRRWLQLKRL
ncbi:MAG: hypothetical protein GXO66_02590 [Euryarchaeota archaeon]|nr:hypothetical protein [Euryarchaeota archaeon]